MINYLDAIITINPNAEVSIKNNDYNQITWHNIKAIDKATLDAKVSELETIATNEEADKETKKASAKQKLLDLGLTEEEIKLTFGI